MRTRPVAGLSPLLFCAVCLSQTYRLCVSAASAPAPSGANSNENNGGISLSAIPGLGSVTKHKWWVWLLVSIAGAFSIVIVAFVIRGCLRYRRHKKVLLAKEQALQASRAEDAELGVGMFKAHPEDFKVTNPMYTAAKPWDPMNSQEPLLLSAFRVPAETSIPGTRGLPQLPAAHHQEFERRTGRRAPGAAASAAVHGSAHRQLPAGLKRQNSM